MALSNPLPFVYNNEIVIQPTTPIKVFVFNLNQAREAFNNITYHNYIMYCININKMKFEIIKTFHQATLFYGN